MVEIKQKLNDEYGRAWSFAAAYYRNENDFIDTINKIKDNPERQTNGRANANCANRFNDDYEDKKAWYGCDGYAAAVDLLENGYKCDVSPMRAAYNIASANDPAVKHTLSFAGSIPSISDYLAGRPRDMRRAVAVARKVVNVYVDCAISCGVTEKKILNANKQIAAYIGGLEKAGYSVNLFVCEFSVTEKNNLACSILKLKDAACRTNLARYMFPLVHPAFSRVYMHLDLAFNPVFSKSHVVYGLASPITTLGKSAYKAMKAILPANSVVFSTQAIVSGQSIDFQVEQMKTAMPWKRTSGASIPA